MLALTTLWVREHNRIAKKLACINPHWNDEMLFQVTKRIQEGRYQHIAFAEWLPWQLGPKAMDDYDLWVKATGRTTYDENLDGTLHNEFTAAHFRYAHANVDHDFWRFGDHAVTRFLFRIPPTPQGADLFAIDMQRGRDHGVRPYVDWVRHCRNITISDFADLKQVMPEEVAALYEELYE
ncbi:hypothetical protein HPB48_012126 [Haemaphysalis longicornis]|uniref:Uncharacterized protein n=1 Tax=Haemaphysalis longicornis TaxID=44386 RepID=A0A9J6FMW6_HAELO|nr:hypothetical protein HPB48_012126 [Haemaphysalis longicornis]